MTAVGGGTRTLSRLSLRDQALEVLREMVVSGELPSGERINEAELAARLGISRGPLREALQRLGAEGFIEFRASRGAFVRTITLDDLRHMYELLELIEVKAAELAATRAPESGINELRELHGNVEKALHAATAGAHPSAFDVHELILQLSGNPALHRVGLDLQNQIRLARATFATSPERARQALAERHKIVTAIADRDAATAAHAMAEHLQNALDHLLTTDSRGG
jgi:DNA-binding GntR family transcriptional regulator